MDCAALDDVVVVGLSAAAADVDEELVDVDEGALASCTACILDNTIASHRRVLYVSNMASRSLFTNAISSTV